MERSPCRSLHVNLAVIMTEDEMVHLVLLLKLRRKLIERLRLTFEHILLVTRQPVAARPSVAQPEGYPRMQKAEQELENPVVEHSAQEPITQRSRPQAVSVAQAERFAADLHKSRLLQAYHSEFLEIAVCPHVVIALEEIDLHSPVHQRRQGCEHPDVAFRDHIPVFIPEIPDVAKKIE